MRNTKYLSLILFIFISLGMGGCDNLLNKSKIKGEPDPDGNKPDEEQLHISNNGNSNATVNDWIYDVMDIFYLWGDQMPTKSKTDLTLQPDDFFSSLLYQYGEVDRFSWIDDDAQNLRNQLDGIVKSSGISSTAFLLPDDGIVLSVRFVMKNSPGEKAGVERGDLITKINGTRLNRDNYFNLIQTEVQELTFGGIQGNTIFDTDRKVSLVTEQIQNFPIQHASIIDLGPKKAGYFVYTQFIPGTGNNEVFDNELRSIFADFKSNNISELIVDLRFNGGGYISSAGVLSSLITKNLQPKTLMSKQEWSKNGTEYAKRYWGFTDADFESHWLEESNNIGDNLTRVFFLVSGGTASASEMVINNLLPNMEVILIGANTYGKAVGSITLDDAGGKYRWDWGLQPIVLKTVNSDGRADYGTKDGFVPHFEVRDNRLPFLPFGDPNETLLSVALDIIDGDQTLARAKARKSAHGALPLIEEMSGFDNPGLNIKDMYLKIPINTEN